MARTRRAPQKRAPAKKPAARTTYVDAVADESAANQPERSSAIGMLLASELHASEGEGERQHDQDGIRMPQRAGLVAESVHDAGHQSWPSSMTSTGGVGRWFICSMIRRAIGAAVCDPKPACSTTTTTT